MSILSLVSIFTPISQHLMDYFKFLRTPLKKSRIRMSLISYINLMTFSSLFAFLTTFFVGLLLTFIFKLKIFHIIFLLYFLPFLAAMSTILFFVYYPYQKIYSKKAKIDNTLPFALVHMASIAESGAPPHVIFKIISEFEEYEGVAEEFKEIQRRVEDYGIDFVTAVREVAQNTPSPFLKKVLYGIISTIESGGDLKGYLQVIGDQALFEWRIRRQKYVQQLSTYAEIYIGLVVAAPLFLIAIFAVMNLIQGNIAGMSIADLMTLSVYGIIPLLNIAFLIFLKGTEVEM